MSDKNNHIVVSGRGALCALGVSKEHIIGAMKENRCAASLCKGGEGVPVFAISSHHEQKLTECARRLHQGMSVDRSVLLGVAAAEDAFLSASWNELSPEMCYRLSVSIGASRGATETFEKSHLSYLQRHAVGPLTSPSTTSGLFSSSIARALGANEGASIDISMTCSSGMVSILNAVSWLRASMSTHFIAGGTEAPLTDFTIAQMKAIGIYSTSDYRYFPCAPFSEEGDSRFVLGEGAAVFALEQKKCVSKDAVVIKGVGFATEHAKTATGITADGKALTASMRGALRDAHIRYGTQKRDISLICAHAPGTRKGDRAERCAIKTVFEGHKILCHSNKKMIGHTFGASGPLSLYFAILFHEGVLKLRHDSVVSEPNEALDELSCEVKGKDIMVNATGFGGVAVSVIIGSVCSPR